MPGSSTCKYAAHVASVSVSCTVSGRVSLCFQVAGIVARVCVSLEGQTSSEKRVYKLKLKSNQRATTVRHTVIASDTYSLRIEVLSMRITSQLARSQRQDGATGMEQRRH